jgi:ion channel-forming bestrophin family protein
MIKYDPKSWVELIFHSYSKQVIRRLLPGLVGIGVLAAIICVIEIEVLNLQYGDTVAHSLMGFVLGLFLVFRTNTAYDRWWEGRKQWGAMVNNARNLAIKVKSFIDDEEVQAFFMHAIPNYAFAVKEHLRHGVKSEELTDQQSWMSERFENANHKPNQIALLMYKRLAKSKSKGELSGEEFYMMDKELKAFTDILGACERIKNTPIPYSYSMYMKKFIFLYVISLPIGFASTFQYWTIPIVMLIFYVLVSVELIAEEIEDPFGKDDNDLPTDELCTKIRANVGEILQAG